MLKYAALCLLCVAATLFSVGNCDVLTDATDCGSTGKLIQVRITPCPDSPCILKKKTSVGLEIDFQTNQIADSLEINMYGILGEGIPPIPWNGVDRNACGSTTAASGGPACPVKDGTQVLHYKNSFEVSPMYPSMPLTVKVTITDVSEKTLVCFSFPVKIQS